MICGYLKKAGLEEINIADEDGPLFHLSRNFYNRSQNGGKAWIDSGMNHGKEESDIHPYQAKRLLAWLYPEDDPASADQTNQAMYAIGSGGYFGEGIGQERF